MRLAKEKSITAVFAFFLITGIIDLAISSLSGFDMPHMNILALLCFIAAFSLLSLKKWGFHLAMILIVLQGTVLISALYASLSWGPIFIWYSPALILWLILLVLAGTYLIYKRASFV